MRGYPVKTNLISANREVLNWKNALIFVLFLFPFFEPLSLRYVLSSSIAPIFEYLRFFFSIIVIFVYFNVNKRISKSVFFLVFFMMAYFVVSLSSIRWTLLAFFIVDITGIIMFFEIVMRRNKGTIIVSMFYLLFALCFINLIYLLVQPEGITSIGSQEVWNTAGYYNTIYDYVNFLERDNRLMNFLLPLWCSMMICYCKGYISKRMTFIVMLIIGMTLILVWSATSIIGGLVISITYFFIVVCKRKMRLLTFRNLALLLFIVNTAILIFNIQDKLSYFIEDILGKSSTLTGRTFIWEIAKSMIADSPLIGYGTREKGYIIAIFGSTWYAHNFVLDILIQGGIVLLVTFLFFIYSCYKSASSFKDGYAVKIMLVALAAWGIMGVSESFFYQYSFWITVSILSNIKYIENTAIH
ncbi:O-antigen ligase family protein [Paenibacillus aestuarii]|uniref:O-antigen ligase family protein n=1 Tax=Paenibacillus aestuarii TaxID=516965 RepID=A0ABW0K096_9BACL|nr:O-antigen ligase family protein [Paenibacillus aestuarii]